ncbi:MAG: galactokinase [Cytophagales bacterium]|nr:galactokinase [Cytophagales bacterium]
MEPLAKQIAKEFQERFHRVPVIVCAPGRINLIGEHVDYNDGYVLPAAIDKHLMFAIARNDIDKSTIISRDLQEEVSFTPDQRAPGEKWINYFMGVVEGFDRRGIKLGGVDCVFGGTIPKGAGLSSSAALCCGFAFALNHLFEAKVNRLDLARIGQFSEHHFAGVKCGLMDQYAVLFGEPGAALLIDCRSMTHHTMPFPSSPCTIVLVDTHVKHTLATSAYNERRATCERGVAVLGKIHEEVRSLRDSSRDQLIEHRELLGDDVFTKCLFVVDEISRTREAASKLLGGDLAAFGKLMFQSHDGLRTQYAVSCDELDFLVGIARENPHMVMGARMVGGGFGGCTINLVVTEHLEEFTALVLKEYFAFCGITPHFYPVTISGGVHIVSN